MNLRSQTINICVVVSLAAAVELSLAASGPTDTSAQSAPAAAQPASPTQKPAAAPAPAGNAQKGQQLYVSYGCYQCHGREGQGSTATGPRLAPGPIAFATLSRYVRAPTGQMPPFTNKVMSDADLADIYAFLQSRPQPPALESIPLLK